MSDYMTDQEKRIARKVANALLAAGYQLRVFDGEEWTTPNLLSSADAAIKEMASTEYDKLYAYDAGGKKPTGWVLLVWGNGEDLVSDYTVSLEAVMGPIIQELA